ncbi:hypothetical protein GGR58DRAFT_517363 [Xylaria digitata]|nr:hypothetical protein GGR58DRAFT_517363 [Xylaria digitata]
MTEKVIYDAPLETIKSLDITESATPRRYRLLRCVDFIQAKKLVILEFTEFPEVPYTALSYVWQGNVPSKDFDGQVFTVLVPDGDAPGDPIGVEVLHETCLASMARGITHVWLDRLCIMQKSSDDKRWKIPRMYDIYRRCRICIVAPRGLQCLVCLGDETQWIHRGWASQEAVAPASVIVLFSWRLGSRSAYAGEIQGNIDEATPATSAVTSLSLTMDSCTTGILAIENGDTRLLMERQTRRVLSPNVGALARIIALMRTSSQPVDMVFSVMGLFGVTLDTSQFGKQGRVRATIALARAILDKGGRATWLAAAFRIQPSRQISTFSLFPRTSVSGKAYVKVTGGMLEVLLLMENEYPIKEALVPIPRGSMDQEGYIKLFLNSPDSAKPACLQAVDKSWWEVDATISYKEAELCAVLIGYFIHYYPGNTSAADTNNIRAMVIKEHAQDRTWVLTWSEQEFCIGGPAVHSVEDLEEDLPVVSASKDQYLDNPRSTRPDLTPSLEDKVSRRARWAIPQEVLERNHLGLS